MKDLETDPGDSAIVSAIITLAHNLELTVVAEGIETPGQLEILKSYSCDEAQGYLFSCPLIPAELTRWLIQREESDDVRQASGF